MAATPYHAVQEAPLGGIVVNDENAMSHGSFACLSELPFQSITPSSEVTRPWPAPPPSMVESTLAVIGKEAVNFAPY
jgi:hypothetical protein